MVCLHQKARAPGEDRTHDLQISLWSTWIMRLTRCLLRYRGRCNLMVLRNCSIQTNMFLAKRIWIQTRVCKSNTAETVYWLVWPITSGHQYIVSCKHPIHLWSRVAQWKRAGPITQRSVDRNYALLDFFMVNPRCWCRSHRWTISVVVITSALHAEGR